MGVNNSAILAVRLAAEVGAAIKGLGEAFADDMRRDLQSSKSGRIYGSHQASAPGESPASDTGRLLGTVGSEMTGPMETVASIGGSAAPYEADHLEFGSPGGQIAPRPLITPMAEVYKPLVVAAVTKAVQDALR